MVLARGHAKNLVACDCEHDFFADHCSLSVGESNDSGKIAVVVLLATGLNVVYLSIKPHGVYARCVPPSLGQFEQKIKYRVTGQLF